MHCYAFAILQALYSGFASLEKRVRNMSHAIYRQKQKKKTENMRHGGYWKLQAFVSHLHVNDC